MTNTELKAQFQIIEDNLNEAYENNETDRISKLLSDDWTIIESSTGISGKEQFLNSIRSGNLTHSKMKKEVLQVKVYNDFAVVVTKGKNEGRYLGEPFYSEQWVTNIYRKNGAEWICIMTQEVPVICK